MAIHVTIGRLLLTSSGITNDTIREALVDLLGKPISESSALFAPNAIYAYPHGMAAAWQGLKPLAELGWKTFGLLELSALPSLPDEVWRSQVEAADAIIVGGGNKFYLSYWMQRSGLFDLLPRLLEQGKVYVGTSGGSMMVTAGLNYDRDHYEKTGVYYDDEFDEVMSSSAGSAETLALVDFVIRPHFNADYFPQTTSENMEKWAAKVDYPLYALDDDSALKVVDGSVEVISQGEWRLFDKR
jgi:dipeptidase E